MKIKKIITSFILIFLLSLTVFCKSSFSIDLNIYSESAVLIDSKTGKILYSKDHDKKMYPASTTKILTAILAIESLSLDEEVTASRDAVMAIPSGYSNAAIQPGEILTVQQLLEVFLVHSANEAGYILAEQISGSVSEFAELMNNKATDIGCKNTNFTNPSGLHDKNHYTTAYDLALIAQYCMKNETFRSIVSMPTCTIAPTNKYEERFFRNTNAMLNSKSEYYNENVIGIKTGYTGPAQNCLIAGYKKDNMELISVVLGVPAYVGEKGLSGKFVDTQTLFDYGIANYSYKNIASAGNVISQIEIQNATPETQKLDLILEKNIEVFIDNSTNIETINPEIKINENITVPINANDILGTVTYTVDNITYTSNLLASHNVEPSEFLKNTLQTILIILFLFIIIVIIYLKKNKKKKKKNQKKTNGKYLYGRVKY